MGDPVITTVSTSRTAEAEEAIQIGYGYDVALSSGPMSYRHRVLSRDTVSVSNLHIGASLRASVEPTDEVMIIDVFAGSYSYNPWGRRRTVTAGDSLVLPPGQSLLFNVDHVDAATCAFPLTAIEDAAREVFGRHEVALLEGADRPRDPGVSYVWRRTATHYRRRTMDCPELFESTLLGGEADRFLLVSALTAFGLIEERQISAAASPAVKRALDFIHEHLQQPLTVPDIAARARLTPRGLQLAFQRELGQPPTDYVRKARLAGARAALVRGDALAGDTVASIAAAWGFSNSGRFSENYRRLYGESPRHILQT